MRLKKQILRFAIDSDTDPEPCFGEQADNTNSRCDWLLGQQSGFQLCCYKKVI
jgi:hypothetical protein